MSVSIPICCTFKPFQSNSDRDHVLRQSITLEKQKLSKNQVYLHNVLCNKLSILNNDMHTIKRDTNEYLCFLDSVEDIYSISQRIKKLRSRIELYNNEQYIRNLMILHKFTENEDHGQIEL